MDRRRCVAEDDEAAETELGADIYAKGDSDGWMPLHWLRTTGLLDVVRLTTERTHDAICMSIRTFPPVYKSSRVCNTGEGNEPWYSA